MYKNNPKLIESSSTLWLLKGIQYWNHYEAHFKVHSRVLKPNAKLGRKDWNLLSNSKIMGYIMSRLYGGTWNYNIKQSFEYVYSNKS